MPVNSSVVQSMDRLGDLAPRHMRLALGAALSGPGVAQNDRFLRLVTGKPHPFANFLFLENRASVETVEEGLKELLLVQAPMAVFSTTEFSAEIITILDHHGFVSQGAMPAMGVNLTDLVATSLHPDYEFIRISNKDESADWAEALSAGYGIPREVTEIFSPERVGIDTSRDARTQFFAIRKGGQVVATSLMSLIDGVAGIYCVSTLPEHRRKGLGAAITAEPLRRAQSLGYKVGVLQSSADGYPVYSRLGFKEAGSVNIYLKLPSLS